jgi:hypothetical protein
MIKKILLLTALILVTSCITPYQKLGGTGGYFEKKLSDNKFKVSFSKNLYTPGYKVKDFTLLRSAEVTEQNNFKFFKIESENTIFLYATSYEITCYNEKPEGNKVYEAKKVIEEMRKKYRLK